MPPTCWTQISNFPPRLELLRALADIRSAEGLYIDAASLYGRALTLQEKTLGAANIQVALDLGTVALTAHKLGNNEEAEALFRRALLIEAQALRTQHSEYATTLNNLGKVELAIGQWKQAEQLQKQAPAIWEKTLGPDHPNVASGLADLGAIYESRHKYGQGS